MRNPVEIENIEDMRRQEGIDDIELREAVRSLRIGDSVQLTFRIGTKSCTGETLSVRITSIRGSAFRGKLAVEPTSPGLAQLRVGSPIAFTTAHIHSLPKGQPTHDQ